jgi:uncharacterized RDD family membrane protein YckC
MRRGVAGMLDSLVGTAVWSFCGMWLIVGLWAVRGLPRNGAELLLMLTVLALLGIALRVVVQVVFVGGCGQTPGQMAMGIGVVDAAGQVPGYGRAARRWGGGMLSMLTLGLLSLPFMLARDRRGLADRVAGTRVVRLARSPVGDRLVEDRGTR